jgi:predicted alpha/beta hydrolase family esterase
MSHARDPICLVVPGLNNSGPDHWQTIWEEQRSDCRRVDCGSWSDPDPVLWTQRLDAAISAIDRPIVLIAHSLGCLTIAWWAARARAATHHIAGALLVAPPDVDRADAHPMVRRFAPAPRDRLPFRSILVASHDDAYGRFESLQGLARSWGSDFVDAGHCGHINADSHIGAWDQGQHLLQRLIEHRTLQSRYRPGRS